VILPDVRLQLALDLVGVFVFALSGGLVAVQKQLDLSASWCWLPWPGSAAASYVAC
jgi:hypothetical protein